MLNIKPTDRVLEIGSGNRPRKRSNVLCDKFIADNTERSSGDNVVIDRRPFVVADGHALPFKDGSFDYVIASHILEHVDDPQKFVSELARVARRGYIETPSELGEKIFGWPFHKWIVRFESGTIVMRPRVEASPFGNYFHSMYANNLNFAEFADTHFGDFYVQHEWEGGIRLRTENDSDPVVRFNKEMPEVFTRPKPKLACIKLLGSILHPLLKLIRHFRKFE
jgi:SAM-dependent methyltransferase